MDLTKEECIGLLKENKLEDKKIQHCILVSEVALFLAKKLIKKGIDIDLKILEVGALLHDIGDATNGKFDHAVAGAEILRKKGFDEMSETAIDQSNKTVSEHAQKSLIFDKITNIVRKHSLHHILNDPPETWEEKLVYYADKRVRSSKVEIVSIERRVRRWPEIHPKYAQSILDSTKKAKELEKEIFLNLDFQPEELKEKMENG